MSLAAQRRDWDELADLDPYWAVCTTRGTRFGGWNADEFFATGEQEVDEVLTEAGAFDLVLSSVVLQHVPRREWIEGYLREFVRVLAPGGAIVFTLPSHIPLVFRAQWRRRLYRALRHAGGSADTLYRRLRLQPI